MGEYTDLIRKKVDDSIKVAEPKGESLKRSQDQKCSECKKLLRTGFYKFVKDAKTKQDKIVCSDCLVPTVKRK